MSDITTLRVIQKTYPRANVELGMVEIEPGLFCTAEYLNRAFAPLGFSWVKTEVGEQNNDK